MTQQESPVIDKMPEYSWQDSASVLLIEAKQASQYIADELKALGIHCDIVCSHTEAVQRLNVSPVGVPYSLVLIDCLVQVADFRDVVRMIRHDSMSSCDSQIPIIALFSEAIQGEREQCLSDGMDAYLSKPQNREQLLALLNEWMPCRADTEVLSDDDAWAGEYDEIDENADRDIGLEPDNLPLPVSSEKKQAVCDLHIPNEMVTIDFDSRFPSIARKTTMYIKLLGIYIRNNQDFSDKLARAFDANDHDDIKHIIHAIKGSGGNLGMMKVYDYAMEIEEAYQETGKFESVGIQRISDLVGASLEDARALIESNR